MCSEHGYLGCPCGMGELRALNDKLNAQAVEQVNDSQELVMLNNFARESNECHIKRCLRQRISDITSWRWVLEDLGKRLDEGVEALQYEHNALRVVVQRVKNEIEGNIKEKTRPGAFCPLSDVVEDAIKQELTFLRDQKRKLEIMIPDLENEIKTLKNTKSRIDADVIRKQLARSVEESCASINENTKCRLAGTKKKRGCPLHRWENRCALLKAVGLKALSNAAIIRQQVRGARTHLSIAAQAYAARVDSALRRRLQSNRIKLEDLKWQRDEARRDYNSLEEEKTAIEQNLLENMKQERVIDARLLNRTQRPQGELTTDEVDRKLRDELGRLRNFSKHLRTNINNITCLQNHLTDSVARIHCCVEDLLQVICLDEERIKARFGDIPDCTCQSIGPDTLASSSNKPPSSSTNSPNELASIKEEGEDDYPFEA